MHEKIIVRAFWIFFPPLGVAFVLPFFIIFDALLIGIKLLTLISFYIKSKKIVITETAILTDQPACFLDTLGHNVGGLFNTRFLDTVVHGLQHGLGTLLRFDCLDAESKTYNKQ